MKVCCYLRVSTIRQNTDNQRPDIENYLKSHGIPASDVTYYAESETSWTAGHQTELARLKAEIRTGKRKYDLFLIWSLDRLCREGGFQMIRHYEFFMSHGVKVVSIKEPWTDCPAEFAPILLGMAGYMANMESRRRSERVRAGQQRVLKAGVTKTGREIKKLGRPKGAKDNPDRQRRKAGYYLRYAAKKLSSIEVEDSPMELSVKSGPGGVTNAG